MRKHATILTAPLAALAVVGTVGAGAAHATGDEYGDHSGDYGSVAVQVETSEETETALDRAGVTLAAVEPATAEESDDGTTEISFPTSEDPAGYAEGQAAFDGGIALTGASESTWLDPTLDTTDWQVSFDVSGQRVDLLQAVPEDGDGWGHDTDLVLTAEGADALNAVAGEATFAEGDVFADADADVEHGDDESEESEESEESDEGWGESDHEWNKPEHGWGESDHEWNKSDHGWNHSDHESDHGWGR